VKVLEALPTSSTKVGLRRSCRSVACGRGMWNQQPSLLFASGERWTSLTMTPEPVGGGQSCAADWLSLYDALNPVRKLAGGTRVADSIDRLARSPAPPSRGLDITSGSVVFLTDHRSLSPKV